MSKWASSFDENAGAKFTTNACLYRKREQHDGMDETQRAEGLALIQEKEPSSWSHESAA